MGTAYGLIILVAAGVLTFRYTGFDRPSPRSKWVVGGLAAASALVFLNSAGWQLPAMVVLFGVCLYVIFYQIVDTELAKPDNRDRIE